MPNDVNLKEGVTVVNQVVRAARQQVVVESML